jgi:hypothetical protein
MGFLGRKRDERTKHSPRRMGFLGRKRDERNRHFPQQLWLNATELRVRARNSDVRWALICPGCCGWRIFFLDACTVAYWVDEQDLEEADEKLASAGFIPYEQDPGNDALKPPRPPYVFHVSPERTPSTQARRRRTTI